MEALQDALADQSLSDIVAAAADRRVVLVPHRLPASLAFGGVLDPRSVAVPPGWVRIVDGAVELVANRPREYGSVRPEEVDGTTVTRLYHLQHSPGLGQITASVFDPLQRAWSPDEPWIETDAGLFVASDGAVTPAHADRHHNLLMQISGTKTVAVCPPGSQAHADRLAQSMPSLYADEMPDGTEQFTLEAGYALYMPPYSIHWVRSGAQSVAMSCGWSSRATVRAGEVYSANSVLRRLRVPTRAVGHPSDSVRLRAAAAARGVRHLTRRS